MCFIVCSFSRSSPTLGLDTPLRRYERTNKHFPKQSSKSDAILYPGDHVISSWRHNTSVIMLKQDGYQYNDVRGTMSSLKGGSRRELGPGQVEDERYSRVRHAPLPVYHDSIAHVLGRKSNVCFIDPRTRQEHQLYKRLNIKRGELARWYYPRTEIDRRKTLSSDSGATLEKGGANDVKVAVSVSSKKTELLKKSVMCKYLIKHDCVLCLRFYSQMFHLVHIVFFLVL